MPTSPLTATKDRFAYPLQGLFATQNGWKWCSKCYAMVKSFYRLFQRHSLQFHQLTSRKFAVVWIQRLCQCMPCRWEARPDRKWKLYIEPYSSKRAECMALVQPLRNPRSFTLLFRKGFLLQLISLCHI